MSETRTVRVTLSESTWRILAIYVKLLQMKANRTTGLLGNSPPIIGAILTYFLRRHGQEIVNAYTEAVTRRTREKKKGSLEGLELFVGNNGPAYPVPRTPAYWACVNRKPRSQLAKRSYEAKRKAKKLRAIRGTSGK